MIEQVQGDQLDSSEGVQLSAEDTKQLKKLLLWCCDQDQPVSKEKLLEQIKKDD